MVLLSRGQGTLGLWVTVVFLVATANAEPLPSFVWGFPTYASTLLPECARLQVFVNPSGGMTPPKPPFSLLAYETGGIPTIQNVGSDLTNLWWTVDHAAQSQLVLSMVDSAGNAGGVGPQLYTVLANSTTGTACHPSNPTSSVTLTTNSTKTLATCDVLLLKMSGGTKPYTITVADLGAAVTINNTLEAQSDTLNWVNLVSPDTMFIASVSDAQGTYGPSTSLISTFGSKDLTCGNRQSTQSDSTRQSSGTQSSNTETPTSQSSNGSSTSTNNTSTSSVGNKSTSTTLLIGSIAGAAVLIGAIVIGMIFCLRRRKAKGHGPVRYAAVHRNIDFGSGAGRGPGLGEQDAEMTPFVMAGGRGTPYMDNPQYQMSVGSRGTSNFTLGPEMQTRSSTYSVPPSVFTVASPSAMEQNMRSSALTPPPSSSVSSFDPYGTYANGSRTPASPSEITSTSIGGPLPGAVYASYGGSATGSEARMGEAGPSAGPLVVTNRTVRDAGDEKRGPIPPQTPRGSVYQHEDISDVVELPPAYKERNDL